MAFGRRVWDARFCRRVPYNLLTLKRRAERKIEHLFLVLVLGLVSVLPRFLFLPYLVQWSETLWGIFHPAVRWKPTRIGVRQLIVSTLWTIIFILTWR